MNTRPRALKPCVLTSTYESHEDTLSLSPFLTRTRISVPVHFCAIHLVTDIHVIVHVNTDAVPLLHDVIMAADTHIQKSYISAVLADIMATHQSDKWNTCTKPAV